MDEKHNAEIMPDIDFSFEELEDIQVSTELNTSDTVQKASMSGSAAQAGVQTQTLQAAMDNYARAMNQSAIAKSTGLPVRTNAAQYKGFAAEEYFKQTLKINALAKGIPDYKLGVYTKGALPDGGSLSGIDMETDIAIYTRGRPWRKPQRVENYQSKIHDPKQFDRYAKDMSNPQYEGTSFVGGSDAGPTVNDKVSVKVGKKQVTSDSISSQEAKKLAEAMKAQDTPEYKYTKEKHAELNRVNLGRAVAAGAATGAILSTVKEICDIIKNTGSLPEDQFVRSVNNVMCGTADGAIRGGAVVGSVQLISGILGKEIAANSLGAVPIMAAANTTVDFAKDLYRCFIAGSIDADDLLCNTINNTYSSVAGFGGAWVGGQVAGQAIGWTSTAASSAEIGAAIGSALGPIGTVVGSVVGGIVFGFAVQGIVGVANKDAASAFQDCLREIDSQIERGGCSRLYYFADAMECISDFKLSFKNLLPCYNLISDLKEYNLHKKAIKNIHKQLDTCSYELEKAKADALTRLKIQHQQRLAVLESAFKEQRDIMYSEFQQSLNTYLSNSYSQYLGMLDVLDGDIESMKEKYKCEYTRHSEVLDFARARNSTNDHLNAVLSELMSDPDSANLVGPFVQRLHRFMEQDTLLIGRQYLSYSEAMFIVNGDK